MPDYATHYYFGQDVYKDLSNKVRQSIDCEIFDFALTGPDDWALYNFWFPLLQKEKRDRAAQMHTSKTGEFLTALGAEPELFSYTAGFLCHYSLDSIVHPYIIACTGTYDNTKKTALYRGNHMAFEHAIDNYMLKQNNNNESHPISKHMLGEPLPKAIQPLIDKVYKQVYGWEDAYNDICKSKRDLKKYLWLAEDPHKIIKFFTGFFRHPTLKAIPYSREYYISADICNEQHRQWHHPKDPALIYTDNLQTLFDKARNYAVLMIESVHDGHTDAITNCSYMTGFELSDPRNQAKESYCILPRYENHKTIFVNKP